jgi:hypothetical protein
MGSNGSGVRMSVRILDDRAARLLRFLAMRQRRTKAGSQPALEMLS